MNGEAGENSSNSRKYKLGLALSGGGFRASLFHVGVLARMAELDLLGKVEVISAVSGGSIAGSMYYLMLKQLMERPVAPVPADFIELIRKLEVNFLAAVQTNPRIQVITNPLQNLRMLLTDYSRTERIARLYNKEFYQEIWEAITGNCVDSIPLSEIKIAPPGYTTREAYNASHTYKIPMMVVNATTLNTGKNFRFTATEVGDPDLGYIRFDAVAGLMALRHWLRNPSSAAPPSGFTPAMQQFAQALYSETGAGMGPLCALLETAGLENLRRISLSILYGWRDLAWTHTNVAGAARQAALVELRNNLAKQGIELDRILQGLGELEITLGDLFDRAYLIRLARQVADSCAEDLSRLSLERAVAASAAVPGIFEPIVFRDVYDDAAVEAVRLADGGVYDNQGLTALFEEECTHIICSDASGQLVFERDVAGRVIKVLSRTNDVLMEKIRLDELEYLRITHDTTEALGTLESDGHLICAPNRPACGQTLVQLDELHHVKQTAFFHLRSAFQAPGLPAPSWELQEAISKIRTDLDSFTDNEAHTLMYDGYYLASHTLIPRWFSDFVPTSAEPQAPPDDRWSFYPPPLGKPELLHHIEVASTRLFKVFRLWNIWGGLAWLVAGVIFVLAAYLFPLITLNDILVWPLRLIQFLFGYSIGPITVGSMLPFREWFVEFFPRLKSVVEFSLLPLGDLFNLQIHVPSFLFVAVGAYVLYRLWGRLKARLLKGKTRRVWRVVGFIIRWKRSPLFPIAVVWAIVAAVVAKFHLLVFDKLFLKAGRV